VVIACATAGIIVGVVTLTGLGLKMANGLIDLAGGHLLPTMFFTMITSLILGMGVPTTANYVITATMAAPALVLLGVPKLAAHLFVFYFGIVADITPPVALAAYAGSGIAKSNPFWTGVTASKLAIGAFIVPYIFVYNPAMVLIGTTPFLLTQNVVTASGGMFGVGVAMIGFCLAPMNWFGRRTDADPPGDGHGRHGVRDAGRGTAPAVAQAHTFPPRHLLCVTTAVGEMPHPPRGRRAGQRQISNFKPTMQNRPTG
jgi:TRAP-type uncharacterized transport system fused permease subunit